MSTKRYQITISSLTFKTPCDGFYIYTGLTQNISQASTIGDSVPTLVPITSGYSFNIEIDDSYQFIFVFIIHCDGYDINQNLQGGYQISIVDLRCSSCFRGNCPFDVVVEIL